MLSVVTEGILEHQASEKSQGSLTRYKLMLMLAALYSLGEKKEPTGDSELISLSSPKRETVTICEKGCCLNHQK